MFGRKYLVKVDCTNCEKETILKIPRSTTIQDWFKDDRAKCTYCGCVIEHGK